MRLDHLSNAKIGNVFEEYLVRQANYYSIKLTKIPTGVRYVGKHIVHVQTEFDYVMAYQGSAVFFDAKTAAGSSFPFSKITPHQIQGLSGYEIHGFLSGYLIWFREVDTVSFVKSSILRQVRRGCSIKPEDGLTLGSIKNFDLRTLAHVRRKIQNP